MSAEERVHNVMSISSHVVHGYVGNKAMTFPLQSRGWNVDAINTTTFSNHPGYGKFKGTKTQSDLLKDLYHGLLNINCTYDAMIVGYVASKENLQAVIDIADDYFGQESQEGQSERIWVLDPVMGDNGKLYVSEDIVPLYKKLMVSHTLTLVTPNQFEMEVLTDCKISNLQDLENAIQVFHEKYRNIENIVVTSLELEEFPNTIICAGSILSSEKSFYFKVDPINAVFSGSGDLFLSLLTDNYFHLIRKPDFFKDEVLIKSLSSTIFSVESVLKLTYDLELSKLDSDKRYINGEKLYIPDLKIVESRKLFNTRQDFTKDLAYAPHFL